VLACSLYIVSSAFFCAKLFQRVREGRGGDPPVSYLSPPHCDLRSSVIFPPNSADRVPARRSGGDLVPQTTPLTCLLSRCPLHDLFLTGSLRRISRPPNPGLSEEHISPTTFKLPLLSSHTFSFSMSLFQRGRFLRRPSPNLPRTNPSTQMPRRGRISRPFTGLNPFPSQVCWTMP